MKLFTILSILLAALDLSWGQEAHTRGGAALAAASSDSSAVATATDAATTTDPSKYKLEHMWNCTPSDTEVSTNGHERTKKLIFVHVFKTAGSSLRDFFREYSATCQTGLSILVHCSGWLGYNIPDAPWKGMGKKKKPVECDLKQHIWRNSLNATTDAPHVMSANFMRQETDILAGHISMGMHTGWKSSEYQYVTFFREAYNRFVSAYVFSRSKHGKMTFDQAIAGMKLLVKKKLAEGTYSEGYSAYLMAPEQKKKHVRVEDRINQIKANLVNYNVLAGVLENMGESLDLLQHLIDLDKSAKSMFEKLDPRIPKEKGLHKNPSPLSTSTLLKALQDDEQFMKLLAEYLKYDVEVYEFAVQLHKKQVEATLGSSQF